MYLLLAAKEPAGSPAGVQHTLVLRLGGDDVLLFLTVEHGHPLDGQIVALRRPGSENDLLGVGADKLSHLEPGTEGA